MWTRLFCFLVLTAVLCASLSGSEEPSAYRCLAPFVWEIRSERAPANLFEAFLSGPLDRRGNPSQSAGELVGEGWNQWFDGQVEEAHRWFREAWHREEDASGLVGLALTHPDEVYAQVFARAARQQLAAGDPRIELMKILEEEDDPPVRIGKMERWVARHPDNDVIALSLLIRSGSLADPPGPGTFVPVLRFLSSNPEWQRPLLQWRRFAGGEAVLQRHLLGWGGESQPRKGASAEAFRTALELGLPVTALRILVDCELLSPSFRGDLLSAGEVVDLAWRLDQREVAEAWLRHARRIAIPAGETGSVSGERNEWQGRLEEMETPPDPGRAEDLLAEFPGHLAASVAKIHSDREKGDLRSALFALTPDLARAVNAADRREELKDLLEPVFAEAGRSIDDWLAPDAFPVPRPPDLRRRLEAMELPSVEGGAVDLSSPERRANLLLFYSGIGCPACQVELQSFRALAGEFHELGVDIYAVSPQKTEDVSRALDASGQEFPFTFCSDPDLICFRSLRILDEFEDYPLHGAVLIGKEGEVLLTIRGYAPVTDSQSVLGNATGLLREETGWTR